MVMDILKVCRFCYGNCFCRM